MDKPIVHFIDEHRLHYEAVAWKTTDGDFANLYVWAHGHVRLIDQVPCDLQMSPKSWHDASLSGNGYSECMSNAGFVFLSNEERATFYRLVDEIQSEQGA